MPPAETRSPMEPGAGAAAGERRKAVRAAPTRDSCSSRFNGAAAGERRKGRYRFAHSRLHPRCFNGAAAGERRKGRSVRPGS